jgi:hypothetical protein
MVPKASLGLLAKSQRGEGLENLLSLGFLRGLGLAVFSEKESFRENEQPAKPLGQQWIIAPVHDGSTFHVSFLLNGPRGRTCTCNLPGLSGTPLHWATRGPLRTATSAHGRICTDTVRVLSALSLHWTTWAAGTGPPNWCRVRDFHPQPLRSERSVSCSWTNAAKWYSRQDSHLQPRRSKRRTLII